MVSKASAFKITAQRTDRATHRRPGHGSVPGQPVRRTRRRTQQVLRRLLRHLRPRQRGRHGPGAAAGRGRGRRGRHRAGTAICVGPQRAGDGAHRRRVRPAEGPAAGLGGDGQHRARARRTCSPARRWPPSTGCPCCCCRRTPSPPGSARRCCRTSNCRHDNEVTVNDAFKPLSRFFDRVWRPEQLPVGAARRDAGAHRPGRDRRGHHRAAAGRAGRGLRLAGIAVRRTHLAHRPPAAGAVGDRPGRRDHPRRRNAR